MTTLRDIADLKNSSSMSTPKLPKLKRAEDILELQDPLGYMGFYWTKDRAIYKKEFGSARQSPLGPEAAGWLKQLSSTTHPGNIRDLYQFAPFFPCYSSFVCWLIANETKWATLEDTFNVFLTKFLRHPAFVWNAASIRGGVLSTGQAAAKYSSKEGETKLMYSLDSYKVVGNLSNTLGSKAINLLACPDIVEKNAKSNTLVFNCTAFNIFDKMDSYDSLNSEPFPWAEPGMSGAERKQLVASLEEWIENCLTNSSETFASVLTPTTVETKGSSTASKAKKPDVNWSDVLDL